MAFIAKKDSSKKFYRLSPNSNIMESYKMLQTNIGFCHVEKALKALLITSSIATEGKSTTTANLAIAFAQSDKKVIILDLDLRKPVIHKIFELSSSLGLTSVITGKATLEETIKPTYQKNLYVLPRGIYPINPTEVLRSQALKDIIETLKSSFDLVVIDSPPSLALADSAIISNYVDGTLLIVSANKVDYRSVEASIKNLKMANANILGVVMNNVKSSGVRYKYYY